MSTHEKWSLKIGTMLLLLALGLADAIWLLPMVSGKDVPAAADDTFATFMAITDWFFFVGHIVAYVKFMGVGKIRDKALVLLILSVMTFVFSQGVAWLLNNVSENPVVHTALGLILR